MCADLAMFVINMSFLCNPPRALWTVCMAVRNPEKKEKGGGKNIHQRDTIHIAPQKYVPLRLYALKWAFSKNQFSDLCE